MLISIAPNVRTTIGRLWLQHDAGHTVVVKVDNAYTVHIDTVQRCAWSIGFVPVCQCGIGDQAPDDQHDVIGCPIGRAYYEHTEGNGTRICECDDDDCGGTCAGSRRA